jgi:hypothetical protein
MRFSPFWLKMRMPEIILGGGEEVGRMRKGRGGKQWRWRSRRKRKGEA